MDLSGKNILIAGAASETGKVIVETLLNLRASVFMIDQSETSLYQIKTNTSLQNLNYLAFDIYENKEIEKNLTQIIKENGIINGFVYAAGIGGVRPLSLTKHAFTQEMMNANLYSFIEMVRCVTKKNSFDIGGSIVAISSVSSIKGIKSKIAYSASKAALEAAVRSMASELSEKKIRVNTIQKGWVETDMQADFIRNNMALNNNEDFRKQFLGIIQAVEIANTVAFLLSDATKTITGTSILIDGGYTL